MGGWREPVQAPLRASAWPLATRPWVSLALTVANSASVINAADDVACVVVLGTPAPGVPQGGVEVLQPAGVVAWKHSAVTWTKHNPQATWKKSNLQADHASQQACVEGLMGCERKGTAAPHSRDMGCEGKGTMVPHPRDMP